MRWAELEQRQPRLAERARERLVDPGVLLVVTIRRDGTPRLSPVEPLLLDGELWLSMLWGSRKAADLHRDPRVLVHGIVTSRDGQDGEVKKLNFDTIPVAAGKATVLANFRSFGKPMVVTFKMLRENGGWRIDDIVNTFEGKDYSVREQLSQPYDCGSFMGKPCKR